MSVTSTSSTTSSATPLINITGLASGLDTDSIVTALMSIEKKPQILLQNRQAAYQNQDTALSSVIAKLNAVASAARSIGNPIDWQPVTATASDPSLKLTTSSASSTGSVSFKVMSLASPDSVVSFGQVPDPDTPAVAPGTIPIGTSAGSTTVNTGGGTLNEIAQA